MNKLVAHSDCKTTQLTNLPNTIGKPSDSPQRLRSPNNKQGRTLPATYDPSTQIHIQELHILPRFEMASPSKEQPKAEVIPEKPDLSSAKGPVPPSPSPQGLIRCPICPVELPVLDAIKNHVREDHPQQFDPNLDKKPDPQTDPAQ
ncbi:hypothetical protein PSHT_04201 [Puccinia striiformis]|uniref:C2H2-type domain-containing protein n=1 Tax=Puccinia striiformis TaxID=27350 RepID=A0A2S4WDJ8_9BASI|nr:hypothetical protein PSHT_04201 [Puccinia striiformis]